MSQGSELAGGRIAKYCVEQHHDGGDAVEGAQGPQGGELTMANRVNKAEAEEGFPNTIVQNLKHEARNMEPVQSKFLVEIPKRENYKWYNLSWSCYTLRKRTCICITTLLWTQSSTY